MPFFSKVFKSKDVAAKKAAAPVANGDAPKKIQWSDAWLRTRVDPEEVSELLHMCTAELKSRALDVPFLLLPFRPSSDPSAARTFVRNFFLPPQEREPLRGSLLDKELRMTEVMVLISVMKWCWARLPGGVVTWEVYEGFRVGERDSRFAHDAFSTFVPLGVDSPARVQIIQDFLDLLAAVAAHGKVNGLGGHKLSRYAGWWAFEHYDTGKGFESGYQSWVTAADATSHLFFAYLRSLSPSTSKTSGILGLPRSLQQLLDATEYPPTHALLSNEATKVVMIVDTVSPTPYALLRRAKNFEYRDDDQALQQFASYEDPVEALTDECRRVLKAISSTNQSHVSNAKTSTSLADPSWSRFEDIGFGSSLEDDEDDNDDDGLLGAKTLTSRSLRPSARTRGYVDLARPTTPSWADFLSSGFADEHGNKAPVPIFLPPDKILPPIQSTMLRGQSSQSHRRNLDHQPNLDPGELASITRVNVDDSFWWVWISSLASEEPTSRKAVFGRCALVETILPDGQWMVMEEQVKGAAPEPAVGAYIAEKKSFLGFTTKRGRLGRRRSGSKKSPLSPEPQLETNHRATLAPDQQAKIRQVAAELSRRKQVEEREEQAALATRRGRPQDTLAPSKTNSIFTLGPFIKDEASPALQWANQYDKKAIRAKYLGDSRTGKASQGVLSTPSEDLGISRSTSTLSVVSRNKDLPAPPSESGFRPAPLERSRSAEHSPAIAAAPVVIEPVVEQVVEPAPIPVEPKVPVEETAIEEASEVPLPPATPEISEMPTIKRPEIPERHVSKEDEIQEKQAPKHQPARLRKLSDVQQKSTEQRKPRGKNPSGPPPVQKTGFRRLFGPKRSKSREGRVPEPSGSPASAEDPAVAAARRALEGKPALPADAPTSPPLSPGHFHRLATIAPAATSSFTRSEPQEAAPVTASQAPPVASELAAEADTLSEEAIVPPRMRRDEEYDQLSRVDTNEREHADREFSTFDQGPLLEQPAFVPADTPPKSAFLTPKEERGYGPVSIHSGRSFQGAASMASAEEDEEEAEQMPLTHQVSPTDRWAQIRRNAAERAARGSEEQTNRSRTETRTDDGETSGEETIESRVARIKARVAELTGNMDGARR
ncbi:hypothetical protein A1O1_05244 [Capronia coronata CBS 617.96]|uniref:Meiotically up-regulated protein Msb1/Mug8 domain-containing protein n=1 Tax=Capronia coronata CBS 617.96 TaxID=1182541 RepID=W9Z1A9_9EURO|nr:uncharacterized protein A1O1_05244 [Capronia coronata CBS 617.96]EXJ88314.1 hypothetical protein A1O1_05244 [Capronia coronata CBS 617.96]